MPQYTYRLHLDPHESGPAVAAFRYVDAPAPHDDDTALQMNGPSWQAMGSPEVVEVTIVPVSPAERLPGR
jgi:hypothetical protein